MTLAFESKGIGNDIRVDLILPGFSGTGFAIAVPHLRKHFTAM
jgi:hypothetical protein